MRLLENQSAAVNQPRNAAGESSSPGSSPMMVVVFGAVIFAGYMFAQKKAAVTSIDLRGANQAQAYATPTQSGMNCNVNNVPTGPGGYFPQLEPTTDTRPQTDFQMGDPQDVLKLQQYLEGELQRIVPDASEFGPPAEVAGGGLLDGDLDQLLNP